VKIIFVTRISFIKQHLTDLYVQSIAKAFEFELWDLSRLYNRTEVVSDAVEGSRVFESLTEFDQALADLHGDALIITNIMFNHLKKVYPVIKRHGLDLVNITKEGLTSHLFYRGFQSLAASESLKEVAKYFLNNVGILRRLFNRLTNGQARYDYLLATNNFFPEYARHFVKIHHVKYDEYLQNRGCEPVSEKPYALFLDSGATSHPMFNRTKDQNLNAQDYQDQLSRLFDWVESTYNLKVIISAHPKSEFPEGAFGSRPIIKYKTPELIEHCSLVLSHYSTSVINAILARKPLVFITSKAMMHSAQKYIAIGGLEFARELRSPVIDLGNIKAFSMAIDEGSYDRFIDRYVIDHQARDLSNEQIILDFLQRYEREKKTSQVNQP